MPTPPVLIQIDDEERPATPAEKQEIAVIREAVDPYFA